jgi:hypothetical protein
MTSKSGQAGSPDAAAASTAKKGTVDPPYRAAAGEKPSPAATGDLESKQSALAALQAQEKDLVAEIARLRALQADAAAFDNQAKAAGDALDKDRKDLQAFSTNELKALDVKTRGSIVAVVQEVDEAVTKARTDADDAIERSRASTDALDTSVAEAAKADAAYNKAKQGVAEAKRVIGELKALKKDVQAAEARNEFLIAGYWVMQIERRLPETELPDAANLTAASEELGRRRQAVEAAKRDADAAKTAETAARKAREDAEKNRETSILERLKSQAEAQQPETAA